MSEVIDAVYDPGYVSGARVYNEPQSEQEERPKIGAPNGDSAGELIYPATEGNTKRFALMELASAIGWYNNLQ